MNRLLLMLVWSIVLPLCSNAQEMSWRKHVKLAEKLAEKRNYAEAAQHYESAWRAKPAKTDLLFQAGEYYYLVRDFKRAADAYEKIKDANDTFDKVGMKYALSLKQTGMYDAASRAFRDFVLDYRGADQIEVSEQVQLELAGCELGLQEHNMSDTKNLEVQHLGDNINTIEPEFAPIAFSDDILYFSSLKLGKAKIFRSQLKGGSWSKAQLPRGFATFKDEHFCNGAFSPDYDRFYFTICNQEQDWADLTARCEIYVTNRMDNKWTNPQKLPSSINLEGSTNTHPYPTIEGDTEILYFSSNRTGGQGGMDIWYVERPLSNAATDFGTPINAGAVVNTRADEITPFYDNAMQALYFSSNGHISVGGYDIQKAMGQKATFSKPENLGFPINSSADDNYYVHLYEGAQGFFVSNRTYGMEKITTTQEDIFVFSTTEEKLLVRGTIFDENDNTLDNVEVALYEKLANGQDKLWASKNFSEGTYTFPLLPNKNYEIRAERLDYYPETITFDTYQEATSDYTLDIKMRAAVVTEATGTVATDNMMIDVDENKAEPKIVDTPTPEPYSTPSENTTPAQENTSDDVPPTQTRTTVTQAPSRNYASEQYAETDVPPPPVIRSVPESDMSSRGSTDSPATTTTTETYYNTTTPGNSNLPPVIRSTDPEKGKFYATNDYVSPNYSESATSSPSGVYYKVQLIAVKNYSPDHRRYRRVKDLARIDTEYFADQDVIRVLLSDFFTEKEAYDMLETVQERGFEGAFIVKYQDGHRMYRVRD